MKSKQDKCNCLKLEHKKFHTSIWKNFTVRVGRVNPCWPVKISGSCFLCYFCVIFVTKQFSNSFSNCIEVHFLQSLLLLVKSTNMYNKVTFTMAGTVIDPVPCDATLW